MKIEHQDVYNLHIHLLNLVCSAKETMSERQIHDLFHSCMIFNKMFPKCSIDWEYYS